MGKKVIICSLCLSLAFSLVGCGGQAPEPQELQKPQDIQHTEEVTPPARPTQAETKPTEKRQEDKTVEPPIEESQAMEGEAGTDGEDGSPEGNMAEVELFTDCNETVYVVDANSVNIRPHWSTENEKIGSLSRGASIKRTGVGIAGSETDGWSEVELSDGTVAFISSKYLSTSKPSTGKSSGSKVTTPASQPTSSSSDGSVSSGGDTGSSDGDTGDSSEAAKEAAELWGDWHPDMPTNESIKNGHTDGWDYSQYR